jgi:hypothetical protein
MGAHPAGAYPIRHIFSSTSASSFSPKLMTDFAAHILKQHAHESVASPPGGLKRTLRPFLKDLAMKFDDLDSIDSKAQAAQSRSLASSAVSQPQDRVQTSGKSCYPVKASKAICYKRLDKSTTNLTQCKGVRGSARCAKWRPFCCRHPHHNYRISTGSELQHMPLVLTALAVAAIASIRKIYMCRACICFAPLECLQSGTPLACTRAVAPLGF